MVDVVFVQESVPVVVTLMVNVTKFPTLVYSVPVKVTDPVFVHPFRVGVKVPRCRRCCQFQPWSQSSHPQYRVKSPA